MPTTCNYPGCHEPAELNRMKCQPHLDYYRRWQREHLARRYEAGLCKIGPDHPRSADSTLCEMHREAARRYRQDWNARHAGLGQSPCKLCVRLCGRNRAPGRRRLCAICQQQTRAQWLAELKARGMCSYCHVTPAASGTLRCSPCGAKHAADLRKRRARLMATGLCEASCGGSAEPGRGGLCATCAGKHNAIRRKKRAGE